MQPFLYLNDQAVVILPRQKGDNFEFAELG